MEYYGKASKAKEESLIKGYQEQLELIWQGTKIENIDKKEVHHQALLNECMTKIQEDSNFEGAIVEIIDESIIEVTTKEGYIFQITAEKVNYIRKEGEELGKVDVNLETSGLQKKRISFKATVTGAKGRKLTYILYINGEVKEKLTTYQETFISKEQISTFEQILTAQVKVEYEGKNESQSNKITIEDNTIASKEELEKFRDNANSKKDYSAKTVELVNDIDLEGTNLQQWTPINSFSGTFDGNYHKIKNLYMKTNQYVKLGLFCETTETAEIRNLILENVTIENTNNNAIEIGFTGAIVGNSGGIINNCGVNSGKIQIKKTEKRNEHWGVVAGGITGMVTNINNCYNKANITAEYVNEEKSSVLVGGIVGYLNRKGALHNCYNTGNIDVTGGVDAGGSGIAGAMEKYKDEKIIIDNCYNIGNITGTSTVSSLLLASIVSKNGYSNEYIAGQVTNCYFTSTLYGQHFWNNTSLMPDTNGKISTTEMKNYVPNLKGAFVSDKYNINEGYPILGWQEENLKID